MDTDRLDSFRQSLRALAEAFAAMMHILEGTCELLGREAALDPRDFFDRRGSALTLAGDAANPVLDRSRLTVAFGGRTCFLGNTISFRLLLRLARRPGTFVPYEELLEDVWGGGVRSDTSVRGAIRTLRRKLRGAGLDALAAAIDGTVSGHYGLTLP